MAMSDEQISPPSLICKENTLHLHSLCMDILFKVAALGILLRKLRNFTISIRGLVVKFAHLT